MTSTTDVREAMTADTEAIQGVASASWHEAYDEILGPETVTEVITTWYDPVRLVVGDDARLDRPHFVATVDGRVVGFAEAIPDSEDGRLFHLIRCYVDPARWGKGIGTRLLERIESALAARGGKQLRVSILAGNDAVVGFYESRLFDRVAVTTDRSFGVSRYEYAKKL